MFSLLDSLATCSAILIWWPIAMSWASLTLSFLALVESLAACSPRDSMNFMRRSVIGVVHTRVVGWSQNASSIGILPTSSDQPADVLLQVPPLYPGLNLIA